MKRFLILITLLLLYLIPSQRAEMDPPPPDWCYTFDFTASDGDWAVNGGFGSYSAGVGWLGTTTGSGVSIALDWTFNDGIGTQIWLTELDVTFTPTGNVAVTTGGVLSLNYTDVASGTYSDNTTTNPSEDSPLELNPSSGNIQGGYVLLTRAYFEGTGSNPFPGNECGEPPGGDYTRPYRTDDELQVFDGTGLHLPSLLNADLTPQAAGQVYAISNVAGDPVMAAEGGTVTLEPIMPSDCSGGLAAILTNLNGGYGRCVFMLNDNASADLLNLYVMDDVVNTWKVTLTGDDGDNFVYILANADRYISNDMHVNAGCVIGESNPFNPVSPSWLQTAWQVLALFFPEASLYFNITNEDFQDAGITLIRYDDTSVVTNPPWPLVDGVLNKLTVYNEEAYPCNLTPGLQDCLNTNPEFRREGEGWTPVGGMTFGAVGGVILERGASLQQQLNLDPLTEYTLIVHASWAIDSDLANRVTRTLHLRLGEDADDFTIPSDGTVGEYAIPMGLHAADLGDTFWTVLVQNTSLYDLYIQDACVTSSEIHSAPQACYFANSEFDDYSSQWENSSPSPIVLFFAGFAQLPDEGWISQNVSLEPGTYTLVVKAHIYGSYDGEGEASASLSYTWPADTASPVSIGSVDTGYTLPGHPGYPSDFQTLTTEIVVSEATEGDFHISAAVTGTGVDGIAIDSACLQGAGNGTSGPPTPECSTAARPQGSDIGLWFTWHWHNLNQFFQCDLMVLLNKMYRLGQETYKTVGYSAKWNMAYLRLAWRWSDTQLFPWLNGHFRNIAIGQVTTITNEEGGCHDIFCAVLGVIDTLANSLTPIIGALANAINALVGILIGGVNLFFSVIAGVIAFVLAVVVKLLLFLQSILSLLATIITAYNTATPATIEGLPTCSIDPNSSLLCISTWVMDHTIFNGRWGVLFTIILSLLAIHLALWAIGEFKRMILNMSSTT